MVRAIKRFVFLKYTATYLLVSVCAGPAFAHMIGNLAEAELPMQSCRILLSYKPEIQKDGSTLTQQISCSATIVGKKHLISAAHCFVDKPFVKGQVFCPGEAPKQIVSWKAPKAYVPSLNGMIKGENVKWDLALVRVESEFKTTPAIIPKSSADVVQILNSRKDKKDTDCILSGYGRDRNEVLGNFNGRKAEFRKAKTGTVTHFLVNPETGEKREVRTENIFEWFNQNISLKVIAEDFDSDKKTIAAVKHGDSGGGLLCKMEDGSIVLMGVISSDGLYENEGGKNFAGNLSVVAFDTEAIKAMMEADKETNVREGKLGSVETGSH